VIWVNSFHVFMDAGVRLIVLRAQKGSGVFFSFTWEQKHKDWIER
jgi:hypothetical protein